MTTAIPDLLDLPTVTRTPSVRIIGVLTLAVLVFNSTHDPLLLAVAVATLTIGLARPQLLEQAAWWLAIALGFGIRSFLTWEGIDNHVFLTIYWCLAFGCALLGTDPLDVLARSGRMLIGLAFLFATAWKVLVPAFVSSHFFQFTMLFDERFGAITTSLGGLSNEQHRQNQSVFETIARADGAPVTLDVVSSPQIARLAVVMAVGTIVVEAFVAGAHLLPTRAALAWVRPASLTAFVLLTYLMVPVTGFATILIVMALADRRTTVGWRSTLLVLFAALLLYTPLWRLAFG